MWPCPHMPTSAQKMPTGMTKCVLADLMGAMCAMHHIKRASRHAFAADPPYLSELITLYHPSRVLHSSNTNLLARPSSITSNFTCREFSVSAPSTWNSVPAHICSLDKLSTFKRQLKSHLSKSAFAIQSPSASTSDSFNSRFWCYTYLYVCMCVCMYVCIVT